METKLITQDNNLIEQGIEYFWKQWGSESNFNFYKDCIENSTSKIQSLPKFYLLLDQGKIIGSYALLINDIISRQDLYPWFACLFVDEHYRNQGLATMLMKHGLSEAQQRGFGTLYLSTDLNDFYEKQDWTYHSKGYTVFGDEIKIYAKKL